MKNSTLITSEKEQVLTGLANAIIEAYPDYKAYIRAEEKGVFILEHAPLETYFVTNFEEAKLVIDTLKKKLELEEELSVLSRGIKEFERVLF